MWHWLRHCSGFTPKQWIVNTSLNWKDDKKRTDRMKQEFIIRPKALRSNAWFRRLFHHAHLDATEWQWNWKDKAKYVFNLFREICLTNREKCIHFRFLKEISFEVNRVEGFFFFYCGGEGKVETAKVSETKQWRCPCLTLSNQTCIFTYLLLYYRVKLPQVFKCIALLENWDL